MKKQFRFVPLEKVKIDDRFWNHYKSLVREKILPYQEQILKDEIPGVELSHSIENFKIAAGKSNGEFYGMMFQDSDVAKWLEAVAYSLSTHPDPHLEKRADEIIDLIADAQQADGYLNTYFTVAEPENRWKNLSEGHELYCAGHLIEAAVAYYKSTGKHRLLDVMCRYADYICEVFGTEPGQIRGYPGHAEIELALIKLYKVTKESRYLELANYFVDERGSTPNYFDLEYDNAVDKSIFHHPRDWNSSYNQSHLPVIEQKEAKGHAVRAMYLYCAMADLALERNDEALANACKILWDNVTSKQMYITGGIGSQAYNEAFTVDYDLPNDTSYTETCASIGLIFWAQRMLCLEPDSKYADALEKALYNGVLSGVSLDGDRFFYVNPLEVRPKICEARHDKKHIKFERQSWFKVACCPPNIARLLASLDEYIYSHCNNEIYVHLYMGGTATVNLLDQQVCIEQNTNYPWEGKVKLKVTPEKLAEFTLAFRIPGWCQAPRLAINGEYVELDKLTEKGYAKVTRSWSEQDEIEIFFPLEIKRVYSHPQLQENAGKISLTLGPLVYCLEEEDNGPTLAGLSIPENAHLFAVCASGKLKGMTVIKGEGLRTENADGDELYSSMPPKQVPTNFKAIPYFAWNNRGVGEMRVWIREVAQKGP